MDAVSLKLARNYTNEKLNSLPSNAPTKTVTFDGGIYSVGNDVVNGQVSDVKIKGLTANNIVKNGNFTDAINWTGVNGTLNITNNTAIITGNGSANVIGIRQNFNLVMSAANFFIKFKIKVPDGCTKITFVTYHPTDGSTFTTIDSPTTGIWLDFSAITNIGSIGYVRINAYFDSADAAKDKVIEIKEVMLINVAQTFGSGNEPTKEQCDQIFANWFDGTKSTNSVRVKSVGKNLFDKNTQLYNCSISGDGTKLWRYNVGGSRLSVKLPCEPNTTYTVSKVGGDRLGVFCHRTDFNSDEQVTLDYQLYFSTSAFSHTFTTPSDAKVLCLFLQSSTDTLEKVQVEKGSTATEYEPYKESSAIINLSEPLRSLPNGVKDEVSIGADGTVKTKKVSDAKIIGGNLSFSTFETGLGKNADLCAARLTNYATTNNMVNSNSGALSGWANAYDGVNKYDSIAFTSQATAHAIVSTISLLVLIPENLVSTMPSGLTLEGFKEYLNLHPITLTYQLAEPIVTKLPAQPPLQIFENGTVYVEPLGDPSETTLPSVEMTIPTGNSNKFGVATHDYGGAAADWTLTNSESKCFMLAVSNAGGTANIIAPDAPGALYAISNASGQTVTIKISGGTGVAVNTGKKVLVIHDGTDYVALTAEL